MLSNRDHHLLLLHRVADSIKTPDALADRSGQAQGSQFTEAIGTVKVNRVLTPRCELIIKR